MFILLSSSGTSGVDGMGDLTRDFFEKNHHIFELWATKSALERNHVAGSGRVLDEVRCFRTFLADFGSTMGDELLPEVD